MNDESKIGETENPVPGRTTLLARIDKASTAISTAFNWIACGAIIAMLLLATVDLVGIKVFSWRFAGAFEVIGLLGLVVIVFAIAFTQVRHGHVAVDFVATLLPKRVQMIINSIIPLIVLGIFAMISWQMYSLGLRLQSQKAVSVTQGIPTAPFAYTTSVCALVMCLVLFVEFIKAVIEAIQWKTT